MVIESNAQLEPDQHGNINYVEYVNMMMSE